MAEVSVRVQAILDRRAAVAAARQLSDDLERAGGRAGTDFARALERPLSKIDTDEAASRAARAWGLAGVKSGQEFARGLGDAMRGAVSNAVQQFGVVGQHVDAVLGRMPGKAGMAAAGIAGVGLAAAAVGKQLYDLGAQFDDTFDAITVRTGKVGSELDSLADSVTNVAKNTAASLESIGDVAGRLSQMGLAGASLEKMTKQIADLQEMTGEALNIRELAKTFRVFGVDVERNGVDVIDDLFRASQRTGQPIGEMIAALRAAGPVARDLGLNLGQTAALLGQLEQAGVGAEVLRPALQRMVATVGKDGADVRAELERIISDIATLPESLARALAIETFGARTFEPIFRAIRDGTLDVQALNEAFADTGLSVEEAREATADWQEELTKTVNQLKTELEPAASGVFGGISTMIQQYLVRPFAEFNNMLAGIGDLWASIFSNPPALPTGPMTLDQNGNLVPAAQPTPLGNPLEVITGNGGVTVGRSLEELLTPPGAPGPPPAPPVVIGGRAGTPHGIPSSPARDWWTSLPRPWDPEGSRSGSGSGSQTVIPTVPYSGDPMELLTGYPVDSSLYSSASAVLDARHRQAQAEAKLNALLRDNTATAESVQQARNDLAIAERESYEAELRLNEAKQSATEKLLGAFNSATGQVKGMAGELQQIGAEIDQDFGFSQGLPGVFSNLFKLIANAVMAPVIGALSGVTSVYGTAGKGSGLLGLLSPRQSMYGTLPNIFGQYPPGMVAGPGGYGVEASSSWAPGSWTGQLQTISGPAAAIEALARFADGGQYGWGASDLVNGLADCSGAISDLVELLKTGTTSPGRLFDTNSAGSVLQSMGAVPGFIPGALNIGISHAGVGHMAATLPSGINFESGGSHGGIAYGGSAAGALDPQFTEHWALPVPGATPVVRSTQVGLPASATGFGRPPGPAGGPGTGAGFPGRTGPPTMIPGTHAFGSIMGTGNASTPMMGRAYGEGRPPQEGFGLTGGGLLGVAAGAVQGGIAAAGAMAGGGAPSPFIGQAAQIGIDEINRAIEAGAELTGIAVEGLMETFLPVESELADPARGWAGRILGSIAGVSASVPNIAGVLTEQMQGDQPLTPEQVAAKEAQRGAAAVAERQGTQVNVNIDNTKVPDIRSEAAVHQQNANMQPGGRT